MVPLFIFKHRKRSACVDDDDAQAVGPGPGAVQNIIQHLCSFFSGGLNATLSVLHDYNAIVIIDNV